MKRFKNILFVADGADGERSALRRALALAGDNGARLTVMDVIDEFSTLSPDAQVIEAVRSLQKALARERARELERLLKSVRAPADGVRTAIEIRPGKPFIQIIRQVLSGRHDLLVKAPRGDIGVLKMLFGSTDLHLLRKCPCPIWLANPGRRRGYERILAAVDPYSDAPESAALDRTILELAAALAALEKSELHVVHVWRLEGEEFLRGRLAGVANIDVDEMTRDVERAHQQRLARLLRPYAARKPVVHFKKGVAAQVIPAVARRTKADLLVMGTVGRSGVEGLLIGNTAERILNAVRCSVLTVKPHGFVTPVKS